MKLNFLLVIGLLILLRIVLNENGKYISQNISILFYYIFGWNTSNIILFDEYIGIWALFMHQRQPLPHWRLYQYWWTHHFNSIKHPYFLWPPISIKPECYWSLPGTIRIIVQYFSSLSRLYLLDNMGGKLVWYIYIYMYIYNLIKTVGCVKSFC